MSSAPWLFALWLGVAPLQDPAPAPEGEAGGEQEEQSGQGSQEQEPPAPEPPQSEEPVPVGGDAPPVVDPALAPAAAEPVAEPAAPARPAVVWPLDAEGIAAHLRNIASAHPELAMLQVLGQSAEGREILALTLTSHGPENGARPSGKPALLLVDSQGSASRAPEAILELAWRLVERCAGDERIQELLARSALVIAPALDPDARALPHERASAVSFERNFPAGWQPETVRPGAGRISLALPEVLACVRFLTGLRGAAVVIGFAPAAPARPPYAEAELPELDREVFTRLAQALELPGKPAVATWPELGSPGGSFFDFAYQARGLYPVALPLPSEDERGPEALEEWNADVLERVLRGLALLPRVEIVQERLERLAAETWQLDVRIQNSGLVPTLSELARRREPGPDVDLRLEGAKLVASAYRPAGDVTYQDASLRGPRGSPVLCGGTLAGGESRWLRLILDAGPGARVQVTAGSPWGGAAGLESVLP